MPNLIERAGMEAARRNIAHHIGKEEGFFAPNFDIPIFDPANNEMDDYYCLRRAKEWRRDQFRKFCKTLHKIWTVRLEESSFSKRNTFIFGMYETGDYMSAYLEVVDND